MATKEDRALVLATPMEVSRPLTDGPWTRFMDMSSGGGQKLDWSHILIQAPQKEAERVFFARFGRNPNRVTCTCCGPDYSISEDVDLYQATAFDRNCRYDDTKRAYVEEPAESTYRAIEHVSLDQYIASGAALLIPRSSILDDERTVRVPRQGYVWADDADEEDV